MILKSCFTCCIGSPPPEATRRQIDDAKRIVESGGWSYTLYGKDALDRYADDPYVRALLGKGDKTAFVVDRIRLLLARDEGGFWVDADCKFIRPMSILNTLCERPDLDFVAGLRNPWRPHIGIGRGIPISDNTVFGSAKGGRMVKRVLDLYKPENARQTGHSMGMEVLRSSDQNTVLLGYKYFYVYDETPSPETILLHDLQNLKSWIDEIPKI